MMPGLVGATRVSHDFLLTEKPTRLLSLRHSVPRSVSTGTGPQNSIEPITILAQSLLLGSFVSSRQGMFLPSTCPASVGLSWMTHR